MMKPARMIPILLLAASIGLFTGCGKQGTTSSSTNETVAPAASESTEEESSQAVAQQSVDEIKWNEVKDPLIEEGMITKLQAAVAAFVANDLDQFHAALAPDVGTAYNYLLEQPVMFTGISKAIQENNRLWIPVVGKRLNKEEGSSPDVSYAFYFEKDKQGIWQIVAID